MTQNAVFYDHIRHVLGGETGDLPEHEILRLAADWFSGAHAWQFLIRPLRLHLRASLSITTATYTHTSRELEKIGAFADYEYVAGDIIEVDAGANADLRAYPIESRLDDDTIVLAEGLGAAADGDSDIGGTLPNQSIALPTDFMAFPSPRALWSRGTEVRSLEFTSREVFNARRASRVDSDGTGSFIGVVTELMDRGAGLSRPVLEIFPGVTTARLDAFRGYYRSRLVIDPSSDQNPVPLPAGRPALEIALIKAARAFALGLEEGEEADRLSLEEHLRRLISSDIWQAARKQDGLQQPTVGPLRGGVGERLRYGPRTLATEVNGPS